MSSKLLDNPAWSSLSDLHSNWARGGGDSKWYPRDVAPFLAVRESQPLPELPDELHEAYVLGVTPRSLPQDWQVSAESQVVQMAWGDQSIPSVMLTGYRMLDNRDRAQMQALAARAFPAFFRARTAELGQYVGAFEDDRLIAMAGERMAFGLFQEISGVCTHPDFLGRGYARQLTLALLQRHRMLGLTSFLHVSAGNTLAFALYASMGFAQRAVLPMIKIGRRG